MIKVDNAIILAAGGSDMSAKSVYSMPKGLYKKNGETLIERQIRQLKEVGITDITVVVGYKQEMYFFLEEKHGVTLEINPDLKKNNIFSLYVARRHLRNTYILNCDNYFEENPFSAEEERSYHAVVRKGKASSELLVRTNDFGRIVDVYSGDASGLCIYGHAFIDGEFSSRLIRYMDAEMANFRVSALFWEEFVARHIENLDIYVKEYLPTQIYEFDSIQEIQNIDSLFLENVGGRINGKICEVLKCRGEDVSNIEILQKGLTNVLFTFLVRGEKYILRYPGESSSNIVYRKKELRAQEMAAKVGIDNTFIYMDEFGIKISKFVKNTKNLDGVYYADIDLMKRIAKAFRRYHDAGRDMEDWREYFNNPIEESDRLMREASRMKSNLFTLFGKEREMVARVFRYAEKDGVRKTMCHNDFNADNCLLTENSLDIIDYEFAGFNDPAYDFGRVLGGYDFDSSEIDAILEAYFGRPATKLERLHWLAYVAIHCWYYFNWALYKESIGESSRDWMLYFYQQSKKFAQYALPRYQEIYGNDGR